jgi:hypothetical protein
MKMTKIISAIFICLALAMPALAQNAPAEKAKSSTTAAKLNADKTPLVTAIDTNKDGCMSHEEWLAAKMPESSWKMLNKDGCVTKKIMEDNGDPAGIDANGDGKITLEEFLAFDKKNAPKAGAQGSAAPQGTAPQGAPAQGTPTTK